MNTTKGTATPEVLHTTLSPNNGTLFELEFFNSHSNRPWSPCNAHSLKHLEPTTHSIHELPCTYPPRPSSGNGGSRIDLEWSLDGSLWRRDCELCLHPSSPKSSTGMELGDANTESANAARTTTSTHPLANARNSCLSALVGAPLPSTSRVLTNSTSQAIGCSYELFQRELPRITARSHFPVSRSRRNKHSTKGEWGRSVHSHVLKAKPTICRVRHVLKTARRNRTDVSNQDNHITSSMSHSIYSENLEDLSGPEWFPVSSLLINEDDCLELPGCWQCDILQPCLQTSSSA